MTTPEPPIPQPAATPSPLADWGTRAVGAIIDWLPAAILSAVFSRAGFLGFIAWAVSVAYWAWIGHLDGLTGQSPGKAIMGIRLVNEKGELIGSGPGIGRKFAHIVDFLICGLGFLLPLVDAKRQTIADKLLQTYVVTGAEKKQFSVDLWMPPKQSSAE
jgi:uncharacterized RDD family membrane protein YckC